MSRYVVGDEDRCIGEIVSRGRLWFAYPYGPRFYQKSPEFSSEEEAVSFVRLDHAVTQVKARNARVPVAEIESALDEAVRHDRISSALSILAK